VDKKEIELHLKTVQFLKTFDEDVKALIGKLTKRYIDFPRDNVAIVVNTMATICARIIITTSPSGYWQDIMIGIIEALDKEYKKKKKK